jgi:S-adenosylmethionine-diacylgycerolhomoserine-N-methlytransferase
VLQPDRALSDARSDHRAFLNRYYGASRFIYDATRKYYLFGRDGALRDLAADPAWSTLVEVGLGTGRNLARLHRARPDARLGGLEASDAMIEHARAKCPWARIAQGFAEDASLADVLGARPDRVLFSYCLSMVRDRAVALANARRAVSERGAVIVVDFADFAGWPKRAANAFRSYLETFRVKPLASDDLRDASSIRRGPGGYYVSATFGPLGS